MKRRKKPAWAFFLFYFTAVIFLFLISGLLSRLPVFRISSLEISGNSALSAAEIEAAVNSELAGNYLLLFPKNSLLLYPKSRIEGKLFADLKRIKQIKIGLVSFGRTLKIEISERDPYALWCGLNTGNDGNCYFMDWSGFVFAQAPDISGDAYMRYFGALSSTTPLGAAYLDPGKFTQVGFFLRSLQGLGLKADDFSVSEDGDYTIDTDSGPQLLLSPAKSLDQALNNLVSMKNNQSLKPASDFFKSLLYIDLRFGDKVFYKPR